MHEESDDGIDEPDIGSVSGPRSVEFFHTTGDDFGNFGQDSACDEAGDEDEKESPTVFEQTDLVEKLSGGGIVEIAVDEKRVRNLNDQHGGPSCFYGMNCILQNDAVGNQLNSHSGGGFVTEGVCTMNTNSRLQAAWQNALATNWTFSGRKYIPIVIGPQYAQHMMRAGKTLRL